MPTIMRTPYRRARRSHDRFFATFHSFIPLLLLSGKLQNGRKIHPEALWHRTSGFLFQKADPQNQIMMVGFAARGRTRNEWACPKRVVQRKRVPLFLWKKNRPLLLLLSVPTPRGVSQSCKCFPMGRESVFGGYSDRVGIRQNPDGSVSQRAFAPEGRGSTSTLRYMDAAVRRDEGKVVFYQAQK